MYVSDDFKWGESLCNWLRGVKKAITHKPKNASFEEAVSILFGGSSAWYFLEKVNISQAKSILIYGATGSVGTSAIQIARLHGVEITAVCGPNGSELVRNLWAKEVVNYKQEDFTKIWKTFDIVFDAVGYTNKKACESLISEHGKFSTVQSMDVAKERKEDLILLADWYDQWKIRAIIDKTFSLDQIVEAHKYVDLGHKQGNVIIKIGSR